MGRSPVEHTTFRSEQQAQGAELMLDQLQEQINRLRRQANPSSANNTKAALNSDAYRLVKAIIKSRRQRSTAFDDSLFGEPAWDILLELYAAELIQQRISITSACHASAVPGTTALRWIAKLEGDGWLCRQNDPLDGRRCWVFLTERASTAMRKYLETIGVRPE